MCTVQVWVCGCVLTAGVGVWMCTDCRCGYGCVLTAVWMCTDCSVDVY